MNPMDFEFGFKTLWGVAAAAFWYWVNNISGRLKKSDERYDELQGRLHKVQLDYATKQEARADNEGVMRTPHRLEEKIDKLAERKADK